MNPNSDLDQQHAREHQPNDTTKVIPVVEEQLQVGKQVVETGSVRISKNVKEEEVTVDVPIIHSEHDVERVTVNQYVDSPPPVRYEGNTMIISILQEVVVLEKRLLLVEELRVTAHQVQTQATQQVTLRKEEVTVEHLDKNQSSNWGNNNQAGSSDSGVEIRVVPKDTDA